MKSIHTKLKTDGFESWFFPSGESDRCVITLVDSEGNNTVNKPLPVANMALSPPPGMQDYTERRSARMAARIFWESD